MVGGLRKENNPNDNKEQIAFPVTDGLPTTYGLDGKPYMEISGGIANIFKILRVDYIKRLTYTDHPDIAKWGIRFRFKFEFILD